MTKVAFLFSGRGSLLGPVQKCLRGLTVPAGVSLVVTNNSKIDAKTLPIEKNSSFHCVDHRDYADRIVHENKIVTLLEEYAVDLIVLGGYRRIFSSSFVDRFGNKTINTHPSLLPAFPGDKAQLKALQMGVRITGATVHFINNEVDQGPIITQAAVNVWPHFSEQDLREAILNVEKEALTRAITLFIEKKIYIDDNLVRIVRGHEKELFVQTKL